MSAFGGLIFTNKGRNLQAKAQAGAQLNFTRIAVGDGDLGGSSIADLNDLKHQVKSISITKLKVLTGGKAVVRGSFSNQDIVEGFYWKELGVFAEDPDLGEVLYCYGNAGANAEYIPAGGGPDVVEKSVDVVTIIGNAANVIATIEESLVYYTQGDVLSVDQTQVPATPGNGKISQLFNWLTNRIKTITGKANWWDAPVKTIQEIWSAQTTHLADTTPHATTTNITYYVRPDGNDENDGSANDAAHAFETIQHAIDVLPPFVNHIVTINVSSGIYPEDVLIFGFNGKGAIYINGYTNMPDENNAYTINSIFVATCSISVFAKGFKGATTIKSAFESTASQYVGFTYCLCNDAAAQPGFRIQRGIAHIQLCDASNRSVGISALGSSTVFSNTNSGTGNTIGLESTQASTIGKSGTQPAGTTAESFTSGGVIR